MIFSCVAPGIVSNCPSNWTDLASAIQVTWATPERPNGLLLRYHLQLTSYDGRTVIATDSVGSGTLFEDLDNSELREYQHICGFCLLGLLLPSPPTPTEDGVPYILSIFAENSAGNGTKCNVTDFTNELGECTQSQKQSEWVE